MSVVARIFLTLSVFATVFCEAYTPILMWHGLGDTCCMQSQEKIANHLRKALPGVYLLQLQIGESQLDDLINSFIMHPDKQIEIACKIIQEDPVLANGYNAIGWSQGSQFVRGLAQRCPKPRMNTLITMAGQHQGLYGIPTCDPITKPLCDRLRMSVNDIAYLRIVQETMVPATYWHNALNKTAYITGNTYLADINNEKYINQTYITNLQLLENFVMVKYDNDTGVIPKESSWFGFYKERQSVEVETLYESDLYISDRLGLKQLNEQGKLHLLLNDWEHPQFHWPWFKENIVDRFLKEE